MGVLGLTTVGAAANIVASLYASYYAHTAHLTAHRPPAPAPAAGHPAVPQPPTEAPSTSTASGTAVTSTQTTHSPTEHATSPQATSAQQSITPPATSSGTPSTSPPSTPPNPTFDGLDRDIMAEIQQELANQRAYVRTAPQVPVTSPTPSPFRQLNGQIICEPSAHQHLDLHMSWTNNNNHYQTRHVQCTRATVLEIPHDARNVTVEGPGLHITQQQLLWARIGPRGVETCGMPDRFNIVRRLLDLTSSLRESQEWSAVQQVTEHILEQASSEAPPEFMAQMEALNREATLHIDAQNAHAAALAGIGLAAVGVAGVYAGYQLYRGYQQGRRGWDLFTYPLEQAANSLGLLPPPEYEVLPLIEMEEVRVDVPEQEPAQAHVQAPPAAAALQNPPPPPPPLPIDDDEGFGEDDDLALFAQQRVHQWLQQHHLMAEAPEQQNNDDQHSSDEE